MNKSKIKNFKKKKKYKKTKIQNIFLVGKMGIITNTLKPSSYTS